MDRRKRAKIYSTRSVVNLAHCHAPMSHPLSTDQLAAQRTDLAAVRTNLANERTMLAYGRTALMLVASGVTLMKLSAGVWDWFSVGLIAAAALLLFFGIFRYAMVRRAMARRG